MYAPRPTTRLRGADLRTADLAEVVLARADLRGADLRGAALDGRDLRGADLRDALLDGASLANARLDDARLDRAQLSGTHLHGAVLARASLVGACLREARLEGAVLVDTLLHDADFEGAHASGADFRRSEGYAISGRGLVLARAQLDGAVWVAAVLVGADLRGASARATRFDRARLAGANLAGARLEDAVLDDADMEQVDLRDALARRSALAGVRGAVDARGADLRGADLRVGELARWDLDHSRLTHARVRPSDVRARAAVLEASGWSRPRTYALLAFLDGAAARAQNARREVVDAIAARRGPDVDPASVPERAPVASHRETDVAVEASPRTPLRVRAHAHWQDAVRFVRSWREAVLGDGDAQVLPTASDDEFPTRAAWRDQARSEAAERRTRPHRLLARQGRRLEVADLAPRIARADAARFYHARQVAQTRAAEVAAHRAESARKAEEARRLQAERTQENRRLAAEARHAEREARREVRARRGEAVALEVARRQDVRAAEQARVRDASGVAAEARAEVTRAEAAVASTRAAEPNARRLAGEATEAVTQAVLWLRDRIAAQARVIAEADDAAAREAAAAEDAARVEKVDQRARRERAKLEGLAERRARAEDAQARARAGSVAAEAAFRIARARQEQVEEEARRERLAAARRAERAAQGLARDAETRALPPDEGGRLERGGGGSGAGSSLVARLVTRSRTYARRERSTDARDSVEVSGSGADARLQVPTRPSVGQRRAAARDTAAEVRRVEARARRTVAEARRLDADRLRSAHAAEASARRAESDAHAGDTAYEARRAALVGDARLAVRSRVYARALAARTEREHAQERLALAEVQIDDARPRAQALRVDALRAELRLRRGGTHAVVTGPSPGARPSSATPSRHRARFAHLLDEADPAHDAEARAIFAERAGRRDDAGTAAAVKRAHVRTLEGRLHRLRSRGVAGRSVAGNALAARVREAWGADHDGRTFAELAAARDAALVERRVGRAHTQSVQGRAHRGEDPVRVFARAHPPWASAVVRARDQLVAAFRDETSSSVATTEVAVEYQLEAQRREQMRYRAGQSVVIGRRLAVHLARRARAEAGHTLAREGTRHDAARLDAAVARDGVLRVRWLRTSDPRERREARTTYRTALALECAPASLNADGGATSARERRAHTARARVAGQRLDVLLTEDDRLARVNSTPEGAADAATLRALATWRRAATDVTAVPRRSRTTALGRTWWRWRAKAVGASRPVVIGPGALLEGALLDGHDLRGADLTGARLARARLAASDLRGAQLAGADLSHADLSTADMRGADLRGAILTGADFDQALLGEADLTGADVRGAWLGGARGLDGPARAALRARGAELGDSGDSLLALRAGTVLAAGVGALVVVYLGVRFVVQPEDGAALEQAASLAQQEGNAATAAERFAELAKQASAGDSRAAFLLEAAAAYEESGDLSLALDTYARAVEAVAGTPGEPAALLRQAAAMSHADLPEAAAERYEALLQRIDLGPTQSAEALVGLAQIRGVATVAARQQALLDAAPTTEMRGSTALALADGWAAMGRLDLARDVLGRVLAAEGRADPSGTLRLRQAHFMAEDGAADQALALYTQLAPDSPEARLGAADLLARRGDDVAARTMLAPLLSVRTAFGARARNAAAEFALRAGDDAAATALLREVLGISDAEPRVRDDARILLARVLVTTDPTASDALVDANPTIRGALLLGQARSLRQAGKRGEARARWAAVAEDSTLDAETHVEAQMALAEMDVQDGAADSAVERYRGMSEGTLPDSARSRVQLGLANALVRVGRIQDAEVSYGALLQTSTAADVLAQAKLGLAHAADQRGQGERATRLLVEVGRGEGPWAFEALYELGQLRERAGDTTAGIEAYRLARTRAGVEADRRTAVSIALAQALERKGDPGAATLFAELLEAPDPLVRVAARLSVADGAVESDAARALALYDAALGEAGPGEARARARAGWVRASVALGRADAALTRLRAWLETESDSALRGELAVAAARALRAEGRASDAATLGERYGKDGGFELAMERAGALREIGRAAEAATALEGVRGASGDDEVWRTEARAEALLAAGQFDAAKLAFQALGKLGSGADAATLGLAKVAREQGDAEGALALLGRTTDPRAAAERAQVLESFERFEEAETAWRRLSLAADPEQRSAGVVGLARVRLLREDPAGALAAADTLKVPDAGYKLTHAQVRAEALLSLRRFDEARAVYRTLTFDAEARTVALLGEAEVELATDRPEYALRLFQKAEASTSDAWYQANAVAGSVRAAADRGDRPAARAALARLRAGWPDRADLLGVAATAAGEGP